MLTATKTHVLHILKCLMPKNFSNKYSKTVNAAGQIRAIFLVGFKARLSLGLKSKAYEKFNQFYYYNLVYTISLWNKTRIFICFQTGTFLKLNKKQSFNSLIINTLKNIRWNFFGNNSKKFL